VGQVRIQLIGAPADVAAVAAQIATAIPLAGQSPQQPSRKRAGHVLVYARTKVGDEAGHGGDR
jgi:hypothetical protein